MNENNSFIGIDFGTTNSSAAWFNPKNKQPEILKNAEDSTKTPSVVYYGEDETLVGEAAENILEEFENLEDDEQQNELQRYIKSIKRRLLSPPRIALPDNREVTSEQVVAEIIGKLKRDAEERHFHEEVKRAVISHPATFGVNRREKIKRAGENVGLEVELIEEPVAAAVAFAQMGLNVGKCILVYDLGGGTFDLALVVREGENSFRLAMETDGDAKCGGDDFDQILYDFWDEQAQSELGRRISLTEGTIYQPFMLKCRKRKHDLTNKNKAEFSSLLPGGKRLIHRIDRATFNNLINATVDKTVRKTKAMLERAQTAGHKVDTVVLIGGASRVPLVEERLTAALNLKPLKFKDQDVAVALGAAYFAHQKWGEKKSICKSVNTKPVSGKSQTQTEGWWQQKIKEAKNNPLSVIAQAQLSEIKSPPPKKQKIDEQAASTKTLAAIQSNRQAFLSDVKRLSESAELQNALKKNLPKLADKLAEPLAEGLLKNAIEKSLFDWRDGKIGTLNELEPEIKKCAARWVESSAGQQILQKSCAAWLQDLTSEFAKLTDPICDKHKIPKEALRLNQKINVGGVNTSSTGNLDMLEILGVNTIGGLVAVLGAAVIAMILGGGGTALLLAGPIGLVVGFIIGLVALSIGTEAASEAVKARRIPVFMRGWMLTDAKIAKQMSEIRPNFKATVKKALKENEKSLADFSQTVLASLKKALLEKAEKAVK